MFRFVLAPCLGALALFAWVSPALSLPIGARAGAGPDTTSVVVEFGDGAEFRFQVNFLSEPSGLALLQTLDAELEDFSIVTQVFDFGTLVDGIAYDGHSDRGFGGGENYWHYWTRDADDRAWELAQVGASDRSVFDGFWDGWVYGNSQVPAPEPESGVLLGLGITGLLFRAQRGVGTGA